MGGEECERKERMKRGTLLKDVNHRFLVSLSVFRSNFLKFKLLKYL